MLLSDFARAAPDVGIELSVGYLNDVGGSPAAHRLRQAGVEPELVPFSRLPSPAGLARVRRHLAMVRPDVLHTQLDYADLLGGLAARSLGIPSVSTVHVMTWPSHGREAVKAHLFGLARRHLAARVVAVSDAARRVYLEHGWDVPDHVVTVHNGIGPEPRRGAGARVRAELGIEPDAVVAATLSVLRPGKGHDAAIAAVGRLRDRHPSLRLLIVGDGPDRDRIAKLTGQASDGVVLAGHRDDVMHVLDAVDVLLHPSSVDAFPTALLEAMCAGVPVVACAVGGIPEIVLPGRTGVLIPAPPRPEALAEALSPLVADPALRARMGQAALRRCAEEFTARRWVERMKNVYDAAMAARTEHVHARDRFQRRRSSGRR